MLLSEVLLMLCLDQCLQKFINKTLQGGKRLLFNSDPWPPAEQKLEMSCDITLSTWSKWHFKCVEICKEVLAIGHESFRLCKLIGTLRMIFNRLTDIFVSTELIFLFIHCYFSWNSPPFLKLNWQVCIKDSQFLLIWFSIDLILFDFQVVEWSAKDIMKSINFFNFCNFARFKFVEVIHLTTSWKWVSLLMVPEWMLLSGWQVIEGISGSLLMEGWESPISEACLLAVTTESRWELMSRMGKPPL